MKIQTARVDDAPAPTEHGRLVGNFKPPTRLFINMLGEETYVINGVGTVLVESALQKVTAKIAGTDDVRNSKAAWKRRRNSSEAASLDTFYKQDTRSVNRCVFAKTSKGGHRPDGLLR